jgi:hypothetical protein
MSSVAALMQARKDLPMRAYITTGAYATDIYTYTRSYSDATYTWSGALTNFSANTDLTGSYNVAGVVLRESGKKLYPDANPGITTYMVGVYHPVFGAGFIDPNSPKFAMYNSDKPTYIADGVDPNGGLLDQGQPVYTRGTVTAVGNISTSSGITSSSATAGIGYATGAGATASGTSSVTCDTVCGQVTFTDDIAGTGTISASFTVTNSNVDANDVIIVNLQSGQDVVHRVNTVGAGSFVIRVTNNTGSTISSSFVFNFAVIKSVVA